MGEVYIFPVQEKSFQRAYILEENIHLGEGSRILVDLVFKKHEAILTKIVKKDVNGNITQVEYTIPFLNSDDPFKYGKAKFSYIIKSLS